MQKWRFLCLQFRCSLHKFIEKYYAKNKIYSDKWSCDMKVDFLDHPALKHALVLFTLVMATNAGLTYGK